MNISSAYGIAAILGVVAHQALFKFGEWHMQATAVLLIHLATFNVIWIYLTTRTEAPASQALVTTTALAACYLSALYSSIVVYRLFFHRCRSFPGPVLARSSKLWHAWKGRHSQNHLLLDSLHQKYGDFVRTGPSEVTIFDADGFVATNGLGTKCTKTVWYDFMQPNYSIISCRDQKVHDRRRRVWSPAFGARALKSYEPRVLENVEKVDRLIGRAASMGRPVDVTNLSYWFAFDVMGEFAFAQSFGMLDNEEYHAVVIMLRRAFKLLGPFSPVLWLARIAFTLFPSTWRMRDWNQMFAYCHEQMNKRLKMKPEKADIAAYLIKDAEQNGFAPTDRKFLNGDAVTVIIGGSDSSAPTITFILYNLAKFTHHADAIFQELTGVDIHDPLALQDLAHLNAVIQETLRLYPALPTAVQRETPPEGITVGDQFIPGNTVVVVPRYTIGRRERYFEKALEFIPERWSTQPHLVKNPDAHVPFSIGKSSCIGKNLALMDLRLVISQIVRKYHISFVPGTNPELVHKNMQDHFTVAPGELSLLFSKREAI